MILESNNSFNSLIEAIYKLPLDEKQELIDLISHNLADSRREEIALNYKKTRAEAKVGKLKFSSSVKDLKKML